MTPRAQALSLFSVLYFTLPSFLFATSPADDAKAAWAQRDQPGQTEKAIHLWQLALKENPQESALWIDLTKAMGRAVRHARNSSEKKRWADQARMAGEKESGFEAKPHIDPVKKSGARINLTGIDAEMRHRNEHCPCGNKNRGGLQGKNKILRFDQ